jgi:hypothetical protein
VRFIQVPPEIHRKFRHADHLPLYQMIAKNVGIRRARGRFILVTNIDILFSDELVSFLAKGLLEPGRMYRIDRHDVMSDVPANGSVDQQLTYCKTHLIRLNAREGTFTLTPDGLRAPDEEDIATPESGISFGCGWYSVERYLPKEVFRWVANDAEVFVKAPYDHAALVLDLEPGPGVNRQPFVLQVLIANSTVVGQAWVRGCCKLELHLPPSHGETERFSLRTLGGGMTVAHNPRILNFRVYRCTWSEGTARSTPRHPAGLEAAIPLMPPDGRQAGSSSGPMDLEAGMERPDNEFTLSAMPVGLPAQASGLWKGLRHLMREAGRGDPDTPMAMTVPTWIRRAMHAYYTEGVPGVVHWGLQRYFRPKRLVAVVPAGHDIFDPASNILPGSGW